MTWIASDYADGYSLVAVSPFDGEVVFRDQTLPAEVLTERAELLAQHLGEPHADKKKKKSKHSWLKCGGKTILAGAACYMVRPLGCVGGAIAAACACVPKIVKEFEGYSCPGG